MISHIHHVFSVVLLCMINLIIFSSCSTIDRYNDLKQDKQRCNEPDWGKVDRISFDAIGLDDSIIGKLTIMVGIEEKSVNCPNGFDVYRIGIRIEKMGLEQKVGEVFDDIGLGLGCGKLYIENKTHTIYFTGNRLHSGILAPDLKKGVLCVAKQTLEKHNHDKQIVDVCQLRLLKISAK